MKKNTEKIDGLVEDVRRDRGNLDGIIRNVFDDCMSVLHREDALPPIMHVAYQADLLDNNETRVACLESTDYILYLHNLYTGGTNVLAMRKWTKEDIDIHNMFVRVWPQMVIRV